MTYDEWKTTDPRDREPPPEPLCDDCGHVLPYCACPVPTGECEDCGVYLYDDARDLCAVCWEREVDAYRADREYDRRKDDPQ